MRRTKPFVLALALTAGLAPLSIAAPPAQDRAVDEQIEYARGLASSWQFIDLAENVLVELEGTTLSNEQREALALARADVYVAGARTTGDDSLREPLFEQALDAYVSFLDSYPGSVYVSEAQRSYVGAAKDYTTHMSDLVEEAAGERKAELRKQIEERVSSVLSTTSDVIAKLEGIAERTPSQENLMWNMKLDRGRLLLQLGKAAKGGEGYLALAVEEVGEMTMFAPVESSFPQQANMVLGEVFLAQGDVEFAADTFAYVANGLIPRDREAWNSLREDLTPPQIQFRWFYLQAVTPSLIEARMQMGDVKSGVDAGLHLLNMRNLENLETNVRGDLALVAAARALFDGGGVVGGSAAAGTYAWFQTIEEAEQAGFGARSVRPALELALTLALDMAESANGRVSMRAKSLINDLIDAPGLTFGPDVLLQAAKGAYEAREYDAALSGFRRVLDELQGDPVNAQIYGAEVCYFMGECLRRQGRQLEAAMAYHEGNRSYAGNDAYDGTNAQSAYNALDRAMRVDSEAKVFVELQKVFADFVKQYAADSGSIEWDLAERKRKDADAREDRGSDGSRLYREAAGLYRNVPTTEPEYGAARSRIGWCFYQAGDYERAREEFEAFEDEMAAAEGEIRARLLSAHDRVRFFTGMAAVQLEDWARALDVFASFPRDFPDQVEFHDIALSNAVRAAVELGDIDRALAVMERLESEYPDSRNTRNATGYLFVPLWETYGATEPGSAERAEVVEPLSRVVELRNSLDDAPSFSMLRIESRLWIELERWEKALATLERINTAFADDEENAENLVTFVRPDLGVVYIQLDRLPEAHEILAPLVPEPDDADAQPPSSDVVRAYIKSVAGWMKGDPADPQVMAGVGGAEELEKAYVWATKLSNQLSREKYTPTWYRARFLELWTLYQWGKVDSQMMENLQKILTAFKLENERDFSLMEENGCDPRVPALYRWLDRLAR